MRLMKGLLVGRTFYDISLYLVKFLPVGRMFPKVLSFNVRHHTVVDGRQPVRVKMMC